MLAERVQELPVDETPAAGAPRRGTLLLDKESFRDFYTATSRRLIRYLYRMLGENLIDQITENLYELSTDALVTLLAGLAKVVRIQQSRAPVPPALEALLAKKHGAIDE